MLLMLSGHVSASIPQVSTVYAVLKFGVTFGGVGWLVGALVSRLY